MQVSKYANDRRVLLHGDGTATLIRAGYPADDWDVIESGDGGFHLIQKEGFLAFVRLDGTRVALRWYATRDEAIDAVLFEPGVAS